MQIGMRRWGVSWSVLAGLASLVGACSKTDEGPQKAAPGRATAPPASASEENAATAQPTGMKNSDKPTESARVTAAGSTQPPPVNVVGVGDADSENPPEKELTFGDFKIKLKLVEGNHTKNPREVIEPYYISTEPLPYEALRRCVDLVGCSTPSTEDQDKKPMQRVSVNDAKLIVKMLHARLPTHAEWINAYHAGVIKRLDCELTQFNQISIVEEHGADGVFQTPLSDDIRFTYSPEVDVAKVCGMRIALNAAIASKADNP